MGSDMYGMYPRGWGAQQKANMGSMYACTCGPYASVIPPEPCPLHDPERAYWRMKLLKEFGDQTYGTTTTTTTATITPKPPGDPVAPGDIPMFKPFVVERPPIHYNTSDGLGSGDKLACGLDATEDDIHWARVAAWVTCKDCRNELTKP